MPHSALRAAREAIARWSGRALSVPARRDVARISPQARWLAKTQQDLAAWVASGGFSEIGDAANPATLPPLPGPVMYDITTSHKHGSAACPANACIE